MGIAKFLNEFGEMGYYDQELTQYLKKWQTIEEIEKKVKKENIKTLTRKKTISNKK